MIPDSCDHWNTAPSIVVGTLRSKCVKIQNPENTFSCDCSGVKCVWFRLKETLMPKDVFMAKCEPLTDSGTFKRYSFHHIFTQSKRLHYILICSLKFIPHVFNCIQVLFWIIKLLKVPMMIHYQFSQEPPDFTQNILEIRTIYVDVYSNQALGRWPGKQ